MVGCRVHRCPEAGTAGQPRVWRLFPRGKVPEAGAKASWGRLGTPGRCRSAGCGRGPRTGAPGLDTWGSASRGVAAPACSHLGWPRRGGLHRLRARRVPGLTPGRGCVCPRGRGSPPRSRLASQVLVNPAPGSNTALRPRARERASAAPGRQVFLSFPPRHLCGFWHLPRYLETLREHT